MLSFRPTRIVVDLDMVKTANSHKITWLKKTTAATKGKTMVNITSRVRASTHLTSVVFKNIFFFKPPINGERILPFLRDSF